jgi:Fem-1 homolog b
VKHGADVNHRTDTDSTPLRAACFDGRLDIVQYLVNHKADVNLANAYNNTCLMISSYKGHTDVVEFLLQNGSQPNDQANCQATALHYASECGHLEICELLLDHGGDISKKNEYGMTAVITAAERTKEEVVELYCDRKNLLTKEEKIDAYELIGASFANDKDNYSLAKAFHFLLLAMQLRYENLDDIVKKNLTPEMIIPAYENWVECMTLQDLVAIQYNHNSLHMEALTVRERILGVQCPEVAHPVVFRGAVCADNGRFDRCEALWLHALNLRQGNNISVQRDLLRFAQLFSQMIHVETVDLRVGNVLLVLQSTILEIERNKTKISNPGPKDDVELIQEEYETNIFTSLYLVTIMTKLMKNRHSKITSENLKDLYRMVFQLNRMDVKLRDGQRLLHLSVNGVNPVDDFHTSDVCKFPCLDTVKLLLHCGARVDCFDCERNTPLHTLASTFQVFRPASNELLSKVEEITKLFIDAGIHLDCVNGDGQTAARNCSSSKCFNDIICRN